MRNSRICWSRNTLQFDATCLGSQVTQHAGPQRSPNLPKGTSREEQQGHEAAKSGACLHVPDGLSKLTGTPPSCWCSHEKASSDE